MFKINKFQIPALLKDFYQVFNANGYKAYLVGGAVRDLFLGKEADDWDVATNASPEDVTRIFKFVIPTGISHGTVTVHFKNTEIEVTTFRTESDYSDGRHPDAVKYAATIEEDLSRRDFTMNAIAVDLADGTIVDPYEGRKDISNKLIRTVGNPSERFMEDGLRPIRAIRFASKLGFKIHEDTFEEISKPEILNKIKSISLERFRDEFIKILKSEKPSFGLKLMEKTGILKIFIPEIIECRGVIQSDYRNFHDFDVLDHLFYACDGAPADKIIVRIAALFHDIGKKDAKEIKEIEILDGNNNNQKIKIETVTFYKHEFFSEKLTKSILTRIKFSNEEIHRICHLVKEHMFHYENSWTDAAVRRFIVRVTEDNKDFSLLEDLFDLRLADVFGMHNQTVDLRYSETVKNLVELKDRIAVIREQNNALTLKDLKVAGKDLINAGIPAGKIMGTILNDLMNVVLEDPSQNDKEILLKIALNIYEQTQSK